MAIDFEKLSPHLKEVLLNLKHMSPMQRFNELSKPRFELQWRTMASEYGMEKLEAQGWIIPDAEILYPPEKTKTLPLMNADNTKQTGGSGDRAMGRSETQQQEYTQDQGRGLQQRTQGAQNGAAAEQDPAMREIEEHTKSGMEKMADVAAVATQQTPTPENKDDAEELRNRDLKIWHRALEYLEGTMRPKIEYEVRRRLGVPMPWEPEAERVAFYERQLARLTKADAAPRCEHIYTDGTTCHAPKLKTGRWCYAHERMKSVRVTRLRLLPMEDGNSIMLNLMEIQRALVDGEITQKTAGLLMYNQQLGLIALGRVTFKETDGRLMVREGIPGEIGRSGHRVIGRSEMQNQDSPRRSRSGQSGSQQQVQRTRRRIARNAKSAKKSKGKAKGLPLINGDRTDLDRNEVNAGSRSAAAEQTPHLRPISANAKAVLPASVRGDTSTNNELNSAVNPGGESAKSFRFGVGGVDGGGRGDPNRVIGRSGDRVIRKPVNSEQSRRHRQAKATAATACEAANQ